MYARDIYVVTVMGKAKQEVRFIVDSFDDYGMSL
jgi:hypothetical protein